MRSASPFNSPVLPGIAGARNYALMAALAAALCGAGSAYAQVPAAAIPATPAHRPVHPRKHLAAPQELPPLPPPAALAVNPPVPAAPLWPANEQAADATVIWDSQGLRIDAANSSLAQILHDVATDTGAKVEGFDTDVRVFGAYGPGQARDVLSQLLQGSGYNVMLIGDQGQGTPREILLSSRHGGDGQSATNPAPASEEDADPDDQPQMAPPPMRPSPTFGPGGPRNPQQMMPMRQQEEMQRRQHQQPGQPGQPGQPPNYPQPQ